jgi:hypothetical protein
MKVIIPALFLLASTAAFAEMTADELNRITLQQLQKDAGIKKKSCPIPKNLPTKATIDEYQPFFDRYKIKIAAGQPHLEDIENFKFELAKMPQSLLNEMVENHSTIHLIDGMSVTDDPTWDSKTNVKTVDGRYWDDIIGSGGSPIANRRVKLFNMQLQENAKKFKTYCKQVRKCKPEHLKAMNPDLNQSSYPMRVVLNRMYNEVGHKSFHGSTNVVLHEQGHTLDSIYSTQGISSSEAWKNVIDTEPRFNDFLKGINNTITPKNTIENFAELFAYYHACDATREHTMKDVPKVASFFAGLTRVQGTKLDTGTSEVRVILPEETKPERTLFDLPKETKAPVVPQKEVVVAPEPKVIEVIKVEEVKPTEEVKVEETKVEEAKVDEAQNEAVNTEAPSEVSTEEDAAAKVQELDFNFGDDDSSESDSKLKKVGETIEEGAKVVGETIGEGAKVVGEGAKKTGKFLGGQFQGLRRRIGI